MSGVHTQYVQTTDATSLRVLAKALLDVPKHMRAALRPKLRDAGMETLRAAAANASWSTRIPRAMSLQASYSKQSPGVTITVSVDQAPHARVYEGMVRDTFRHPVFDRNGPWVTQDARPYLRPAAHETGAAVVDLVTAAVDEALAATGFH